MNPGEQVTGNRKITGWIKFIMSPKQETKKYYKWVWDVSLGGEFDDWGTSTYFMEIGNTLYPLRQIEVYENGNVLFYDHSHFLDDYGMLCDQKIDVLDIQEFEITQAEFEQVWQTKVPINRPLMKKNVEPKIPTQVTSLQTFSVGERKKTT